MKRLMRQAGTSLLETLVGIAMFAIISSGLFALFAGTSRNFSYTTKTAGLQTDLAGALNIFLDDVSLTGFAGYTSTAYATTYNGTITAAQMADGSVLRSVMSPATAIPSVTLNVASTNGNPPDSIQFIGDISSTLTGHGPDGYPDRVTYQVTSGNLTRTIELGDNSGGYTGGTTSDTIAAKVTGFKLRLYDESHASTTSASSTCYIQATIYTTDSSVRAGIPLAKNLTGEATLRNFATLASCDGV